MLKIKKFNIFIIYEKKLSLYTKIMLKYVFSKKKNLKDTNSECIKKLRANFLLKRNLYSFLYFLIFNHVFLKAVF